MSTSEHLLYGDGFWLGVLRLAFGLTVFWLPGICWSRWWSKDSQFSISDHLLLGWIWSLAVFALVAWPFLWFRLAFSHFLIALGIAWLAWTGLALSLGLPWFRGTRSTSAGGTRLTTPAEPSSGPAVGATWPTVFVILYLALCWTILWLPQLITALGLKESPLVWLLFDLLIIGWVVGMMVKVRDYQQRWSSWLAFTPEDEQPAGRLVWGTAIGFIVLQILSAMVFDRPDWDDCYYLAAVLDFQHTERLHAEEPTHREGLPVNIINVVIAWEMWQAVLSWWSGLNPMVVAHGLLPPLLIALAYVAYTRVLTAVLPRRWVPLALLGVAAYHVWGISSHDTPANFLLTRIWQGKAVLMHIGLPTLVWLLHQVVGKPTDLRPWISLFTAAVAGLAMSTSAVFLEVLLLPTLGVALVWTASHPKRWLAMVPVILACVPPVAMGLLLRTEVAGDPALTTAPDSWEWYRGLANFHYHTAYGSAEWMWLLLLPLLSLLILERHRRGYLVVFPILAWLTFANPFLADVVATYLTSYLTYFRVYWLLPVAVGLGTTLALVSRLLSKTLPALGPAGERWHRLRSLLPLPLGLALGGLVATMFLPTVYVWSGWNVQILVPKAPTHPVADNPAKVPRELLAIADRLLNDPDITRVRLLAPEQVVNYLTPLSRDFRFVQTRALYTLYMFDMAGRREEGQKRYLLSLLLTGELPQAPSDPPRSFSNPYYPRFTFPRPPRKLEAQVLSEWLDELQVRYAITPEHLGPRVEAGLASVGFVAVEKGERYTLWVRKIPRLHSKLDSMSSESELK